MQRTKEKEKLQTMKLEKLDVSQNHLTMVNLYVYINCHTFRCCVNVLWCVAIQYLTNYTCLLYA